MTPMIDVVFLMIVFFVCIDFRVLESKLPAFLPKDRGSQPDLAEPQEQLAIRVHVETPGTPALPPGVASGDRDPRTGRPYRFALRGQKLRWEVGATPVHSLDEVVAVLARIADDPRSQVPDPATGGTKLLACVIEAHPGTRYDDVAKTADAAHEARFREIHFAAGLGAR